MVWSYIKVVAPANYPGTVYKGKYCLEHHYVWWRETNELVPKDFVIHHKNHNRADNRFENLEMMTRGDHAKHHARPKPMKAVVCAFCTKEYSVELRNWKSKTKHGQKEFHCTRSCSVKNQHRKAIEKKNTRPYRGVLQSG